MIISNRQKRAKKLDNDGQLLKTVSSIPALNSVKQGGWALYHI